MALIDASRDEDIETEKNSEEVIELNAACILSATDELALHHFLLLD